MSRTNSEIAAKLQGALDRLIEIVEVLDSSDDVEYENLETLTEPLIQAIEDLSDAIGSVDESEDE